MAAFSSTGAYDRVILYWSGMVRKIYRATFTVDVISLKTKNTELLTWYCKSLKLVKIESFYTCVTYFMNGKLYSLKK